MSKNTIFVDGLGDICIVRNRRAKRYIFRVKDNILYATTPFNSSTNDLLRILGENKNRLKTLLQKSDQARPRLINLDYRIDTPNFKLEIVEGSVSKLLLNDSDKGIQIVVPRNTRLESPKTQTLLVKAIELLLLKKGKELLPSMVQQLANKHSLRYAQVKINLSRGRWGSCSSSGNINLSAFLLLLPNHLIESVILHELAHLTEMNHSERFWSLLDSYTNGQSRQLNNELKQYKTSVI